jgi:hypothetical protein
MQRCPCCNARLRDITLCPRCRADLSGLIGTEKAAEFWLFKAIQYRKEGKLEKCIDALCFSLRLKKTSLAKKMRDFLIQQSCQNVLGLLEQKQIIPAKQQLYKMRRLFPYSEQLQQLNGFADYLLVNRQESSISEWAEEHLNPILKFIKNKNFHNAN